MSDLKTDKPPASEDLRSIAEHLSKQPEQLDFDFRKEYFYWAWRSILFVLFITVATNLDFHRDRILSLDHISNFEWGLLMFIGLLGPAIFAGWSLIRAWAQDRIERLRG